MQKKSMMQSSLGAYLNELGDVFSDTFLYLPFCFVSGLNPGFIVLIVLLSIISEMTGVIALQVGVKRRYDGPMGKSDRAFVFGLIGLLLGEFVALWLLSRRAGIYICHCLRAIWFVVKEY